MRFLSSPARMSRFTIGPFFAKPSGRDYFLAEDKLVVLYFGSMIVLNEENLHTSG
jgi:hypothetical protein